MSLLMSIWMALFPYWQGMGPGPGVKGYSGGGGATITYVTSTAANNSGCTSSTTTGSIDTTGANFLIMYGVTDTAVATSPSDSKGNSNWTAITNTQNSSSLYIKGFYSANATVGTGHTFTLSGSCIAVFVMAFSGVLTASPLDVDSGGATSGAATSINLSGGGNQITPSANNYLVTTALGTTSPNTLSLSGTGFNLAAQVPFIGGTSYGGGVGYHIQTTATTDDPTWSFTGTATKMLLLAESWKHN